LNDQNPFEEALTRLAANRRKKVKLTIPHDAATTQSERLVLEIAHAHRLDSYYLTTPEENKPSVMKIRLLPKVMKQVRRANFAVPFIDAGGVEIMKEWITPVELGDGRSMAPPLDIVNGCLELLDKLQLDKDAVKTSKIGLAVRGLLENTSYPLNTRMQAQKIVNDWVAIVVGTRKDPRSLGAADDFDRREDEAIEVDERGRKVKEDRSSSSTALAVPTHKKTEQERSQFWQPTETDRAKYEDNMKNRRHAMMPMDKPMFDKDALPPSHFTGKTRNKLDPNSTSGKIEMQLKKISNPNKKAWKNTTKQVSISGRQIVYGW